MDFADLHGQANLTEKGGDRGKSTVRQVHKVAWFDGSCTPETSDCRSKVVMSYLGKVEMSY
jgi:hypothetical protein